MPSIAAISCLLPQKKIPNSHFDKYHDPNYVEKSTNLIGLKTRYWVTNEDTLLMCTTAAKELINQYSKKINDQNFTSKIDLLLFVTQTPKDLMPSIAYQAHDILGLEDSCTCFTINAGCSGFVDGLGLVYDLMRARKYRNALLLVGDQLSKYLNPKDFSTSVVFGDAGSATLITNYENTTNEIFLNGTIKNSSKALSLQLNGEKENNFLEMDGFRVFNFAINNIPDILQRANDLWVEKYEEKLEVDYYAFHQANNMILNHVINKMKLDPQKVLINIEKYGNTSGVTIPLLLCSPPNDFNLKKNGKNKILLCGFGVGLSWSLIVLDDFNPLIRNILISNEN